MVGDSSNQPTSDDRLWSIVRVNIRGSGGGASWGDVAGLRITESIQGLFDRLSTYDPKRVIVELVVIWIVVYAVFRFVRGTRAAGAAKGLMVVLVLAILFARILGGFPRLEFVYDGFLAITAVALVVIFQPELRRALIRLGEAPFFRSTPGEIAHVVDAIVDACEYLSRSRFGAIIVIERQVGLRALARSGTAIGAEVSARLLQTIFFPGSALHDLAVVIRGRVLDAAGVQLPMAGPADMRDPDLGARHRAAVGLARECDAVVVVVSEETGSIRIAERGQLSDPLTPERLRAELRRRLRREPPSEALTVADEEEREQIMDTKAPDA